MIVSSSLTSLTGLSHFLVLRSFVEVFNTQKVKMLSSGLPDFRAKNHNFGMEGHEMEQFGIFYDLLSSFMVFM
jgi:hypothetical protein